MLIVHHVKVKWCSEPKSLDHCMLNALTHSLQENDISQRCCIRRECRYYAPMHAMQHYLLEMVLPIIKLKEKYNFGQKRFKIIFILNIEYIHMFRILHENTNFYTYAKYKILKLQNMDNFDVWICKQWI